MSSPGTLKRCLASWADASPNASAVEIASTTVTPAAWLARAEVLAAWARERRVSEGSRVALVFHPAADTLAMLVALDSLGVEVLLLAPKLTDAEEQAILASFGAQFRVDAERSVSTLVRESAPRGAPLHFALATSGVTGRPKVVRRSWESALANARAFVDVVSYGPSDRVLCTTPMNHGFAFSTVLTACLVARATTLVSDTGRPAHAISSADARRATVVQAVPYAYRRFIADELPAPRGVRLFLSAGEAMNASLADAWRARTGRSLTNHYGSTETGMITVSDEGDIESVGRALPGVRVKTEKIEEEDEILAFGGSPPFSYLAGGEPLQDGWFRTGDLGKILDDGRIVIRGRRSIRLNVAGNKVDPLEVEEAIGSFPSVRDCAVVARADAERGEHLEALLVQAEPIDEVAIRRHLAKLLSAHKVPRRFVLVESLPRTAAGKLRRGSL